jgi:hypothetical protein
MLCQCCLVFSPQSRQLGRRKLCVLSHGVTIYIVSPWSCVGKYMVRTILTLMVHLESDTKHKHHKKCETGIRLHMLIPQALLNKNLA